MASMSKLEQEYEEFCLKDLAESKKLGYNPSYFLRMLEEYGAVETTRRLINSDKWPEGFTRLFEMGRLDLTLEAGIYDNRSCACAVPEILSCPAKHGGTPDHEQPAMKRIAVVGGRRGGLVFLWVTAAVIALDQLTKLLVQHKIPMYAFVRLLPVLGLTYQDNAGAAFSFLREASGWQRWLFTGLALIVSAVLVRWLSRLPRTARWLGTSVALILAGALGNAIDRIRLGFVVDFIVAHWGNHAFPTFNVADSAITIGAIMLLLDAWRHER